MTVKDGVIIIILGLNVSPPLDWLTFLCHFDEILDIHFFAFLYITGLHQISCQISIYYEPKNSLRGSKTSLLKLSNYNFNPCGFFEEMTTSFSPIFAIPILQQENNFNRGRKFSPGNKGPKIHESSSNARKKLKSGKIRRKNLLCTKMYKKIGIENLMIVTESHKIKNWQQLCF